MKPYPIYFFGKVFIGNTNWCHKIGGIEVYINKQQIVYALYQIWIIAKNEPTYNKNMI